MNKDEIALKLANKMHGSGVQNFGVFVDLPNGNRGMIRSEILDFGISTGNPAPEKITDASYVVDEPEMMMALDGVE